MNTDTDTLGEQCARLAGHSDALVGLTPVDAETMLPHLYVVYSEGFRQGRLDRAERFGARRRRSGLQPSYPSEFRSAEERAAYDRGYQGGET